MFSFSTSWNSFEHDNGFGIIEEIRSVGFDTVELNFALPESIVKDVLAISQKEGIGVSSLHNICPLPPEIEKDEASPDYYSLAATDPEERKLAIAAAINTIAYSRMFGAKAVVLHAGRIQIRDRTRELASMAGNAESSGIIREDIIRERREKKDGYFENVLDSLSRLIPYAREAGVRLGIENRYYYREMPVMEEFDSIFRTFPDREIGYWHDVGHAEVFDRLGLVNHEELLERFSGRLIGMHLHDIMGNIDDHKVPGLGSFNFMMLKKYIRGDIIKVIEVHKPATPNQIRRGVEYLEKIFG
jgi:sugar phosphate isomerase/epimerase